MKGSVVKISNKANTYIGSGFVIEQDKNGVYVATCGHVVSKLTGEVLVEDKPSDIIKNEYKNGLDLAILYVQGLSLKPFEISSNDPLDKVSVVGYSRLSGVAKMEPFHNVSTKTGIVFKKNIDVKAIKLFPEEAISNGYSGSPVICAGTGKVVGVVNIQVGGDTNYAICASHLTDLHDIELNDDTPQVTPTDKGGLMEKIGAESYGEWGRCLSGLLDKSLRSFSTQKNVWIEPRLHTVPEDQCRSYSANTRVSVDSIVSSPRSIAIQARQQFGLSCLAHHLVEKAWAQPQPKFWLYLDANDLKPHAKEIRKHVSSKLKNIGLLEADIECVILDEFSNNLAESNKILDVLSGYFDGTPIIVMMSIIENPLLHESIENPKSRGFENLHLWALTRGDVRGLVCQYNDQKYIANESAVVSKIVSDLDALNIPRTTFNCLTILKIYEVEFEENPVNRTEMIRRVLFLLFNVDDIPRYKSKPDLKDTEYVLGYFCELMLRERNYHFTRSHFIDTLSRYCTDHEIDLDVHVIFDILTANNILAYRGEYFYFKFSYYILYFAAHRMHHNQKFSDLVLKDINYAAYPELIEFYTGIDRRRNDALEILVDDIKNIRQVVKDKCGLPEEFNIYDVVKWSPSEESLEHMQQEVASGVLQSNLPDSVKDKYADQGYDRTRPLTQSIHSILAEYSLLNLMKVMTAGARALRNSDYANTELRHALLSELTQGLEQLTKVLVAMAPVMAQHGHVTLDGASFLLTDDLATLNPRDKLNRVIQILPSNVINWYMDDMYSSKMGTLIYKHMEKKESALSNHLVNLLLVSKRPKGWDKHIEKYIISENKDTYYLSDLYQSLRAEYQYSFASEASLGHIERLIKMTAVKHQKGIRKPSAKSLSKVSDSILPDRSDNILE